eukprot:COSAG02_NODE_49_length_45106_cov_298.436177_21_plen_57_part_00
MLDGSRIGDASTTLLRPITELCLTRKTLSVHAPPTATDARLAQFGTLRSPWIRTVP